MTAAVDDNDNNNTPIWKPCEYCQKPIDVSISEKDTDAYKTIHIVDCNPDTYGQERDSYECKSCIEKANNRDPIPMRSEQEIRDVLKFLERIYKTDFRIDKQKGAMLYNEEEMTEWLPADVIYQRVDCSIRILRWLLGHPDYKFFALDNILDIIEGYS